MFDIYYVNWYFYFMFKNRIVLIKKLVISVFLLIWYNYWFEDSENIYWEDNYENVLFIFVLRII